MKEQLIEFETAKLAKEKGFDWEVLNHYSDELFEEGYLFEDDVKNSELEPFEYSAPTQSLLQKWLREEHKIFIELGLVDSLNDYWVRVDVSTLCSLETIWRNDPNNHLETYEQALEAGLIEGLKLI